MSGADEGYIHDSRKEFNSSGFLHLRIKMMPFHGRCGIQTTQWRLIFDHERVVVTAMIDVVNDAREIQRNFLRKEIKVFFTDKLFG